MTNSMLYKDHLIEIFETETEYQYIIKKDGVVVAKSGQGYPFQAEAEVAAKLCRIVGTKDGWKIS